MAKNTAIFCQPSVISVSLTRSVGVFIICLLLIACNRLRLYLGQIVHNYNNSIFTRELRMKKIYIYIIIASLVIAGCQPTPPHLDEVSIQNTTVAIGNTAVAMAWTSVAQTQTPPTPKPTRVIATKSPFSLQGDFELSWNIYNSEYNSLGGILTIRKQGTKYTGKLVMSDGSSDTFNLTVISETPQLKLTDSPGNAFGDYMLITEDGYLHFYDAKGFIYRVQPLK